MEHRVDASPAEFHFETSVASVTIKKGDVPERTVKIVMEDGRSLDLTMDEARALVSQLKDHMDTMVDG